MKIANLRHPDLLAQGAERCLGSSEPPTKLQHLTSKTLQVEIRAFDRVWWFGVEGAHHLVFADATHRSPAQRHFGSECSAACTCTNEAH